MHLRNPYVLSRSMIRRIYSHWVEETKLLSGNCDQVCFLLALCPRYKSLYIPPANSNNLKAKWSFFRRLDDPQDKHDKTTVNVSGVAWANESPMHLVVSYDKQGIM